MKQRKCNSISTGMKRRGAALPCVLLSGLVAGMAGCDLSHSQANAAASVQATPMAVDAAMVTSRRLAMNIALPGELQPYEEVRIFPKVTGFVLWIGVDRGTRVKKGQLLATLTAPEIVAQRAEAEAKAQSTESQRIAGEAKLAADEKTYERLKAASATPGVISEQELDIAQKTAEEDRARVVSLENSLDAARAALRSAREMEGYLRITAPFDGVVTKRNVHPGALVGPATGSSGQSSMLRVEEVEHLRLVVAVPEIYVSGVQKGATVPFTVPAFPGRSFMGTIARMADSIDEATRTMPVEMDVWNPNLELASGMFPSVSWPVRASSETLFVPQSSIARSGEQSYVLRVREGKIEQVNVSTRASVNGLTEVAGGLQKGEQVILHPSDDMRDGTAVVLQIKNHASDQ